MLVNPVFDLVSIIGCARFHQYKGIFHYFLQISKGSVMLHLLLQSVAKKNPFTLRYVVKYLEDSLPGI
jgi:hypothetical protein